MKKLHLEKFLLVLLIIPLFGCCSLFSNNCIVVNTNVYEIEEKEDIETEYAPEDFEDADEEEFDSDHDYSYD